MVIGNLEAVSVGFNGTNKQKATRLHTQNETLSLLQNLRINIVTLANNHVYDQLFSGFNRTLEYLNKSGIEYIGAHPKAIKKRDIITKTINNQSISFLNFLHPETNPLFPIDCEVSVNMYEKSRIINEIQEEKNNANYVILILHWGLDNSRYPAPWQRRDARAFVKAGADLIIGHHSHVLQGYEKINNSYVFYSLGNFAFSRRFSDGRYYDLDKKRQLESIVLDVIIENKEIRIDPKPCKLVGIDVQPNSSNRVHQLSALIPFVSNRICWVFYILYIRTIYKIYFYFLGNARNPIRQLLLLDFKKVLRFITK